MNSIKLWILACMLSFLGLIAVSLFDGIILISSMFFLFLGLLAAYYASKAERREKNGIPNQENQGQV